LSRCNDEVVENGHDAVIRGKGVVRRHCLEEDVRANGEELVRSIRDAEFDVIAIVHKGGYANINR
jgi:hypothetical protein